MNKYLVYGHTNVTVTCEVVAETEEEAYKAAQEQLGTLTAYVGNGGTDKLVGVDDECQSVAADDEVVYDDIEVIKAGVYTPISWTIKIASEHGWHVTTCQAEDTVELEFINRNMTSFSIFIEDDDDVAEIADNIHNAAVFEASDCGETQEIMALAATLIESMEDEDYDED